MAENQEIQPRQVAYKVRIGDLLRGEYVEQEGWQPNYIRVGEKHISRANIIATIIDTQPGASFGSVTVDDGSGALQVRAFNEDSVKLGQLNVGDVVIIIGRPRRYGNQIFISYEIVRNLDPLWLKVRQKELGDTPIITNGVSTQPVVASVQNNGSVQTETVQGEPVKDINEDRKKVLELIRNMDEGNGSDVDGVITKSGLTQQEAESILEDLIKAGEIYENIAGKVKLL